MEGRGNQRSPATPTAQAPPQQNTPPPMQVPIQVPIQVVTQIPEVRIQQQQQMQLQQPSGPPPAYRSTSPRIVGVVGTGHAQILGQPRVPGSTPIVPGGTAYRIVRPHSQVMQQQRPSGSPRPMMANYIAPQTVR